MHATFEFFNQPMRYVTDNYPLYIRIYFICIYIYIYLKLSIHYILYVLADHSIKTLHESASSQCHMG